MFGGWVEVRCSSLVWVGSILGEHFSGLLLMPRSNIYLAKIRTGYAGERNNSNALLVSVYALTLFPRKY